MNRARARVGLILTERQQNTDEGGGSPTRRRRLSRLIITALSLSLSPQGRVNTSRACLLQAFLSFPAAVHPPSVYSDIGGGPHGRVCGVCSGLSFVKPFSATCKQPLSHFNPSTHQPGRFFNESSVPKLYCL